MIESARSADMEQINAALAADGVLDHQLLSSLARSALRRYLQSEYGDPDPYDVLKIWNKLKYSVLAKNMPERHLTAACNCISVFLLAAATAQSEFPRNFVLSESRWYDAVQCVEYAFSCGKTKSALQVLETLAHYSREHPDRLLAVELVQQCSVTWVSAILTNQHTKAACISLSCFIKKTDLLWSLERSVESCLVRNVVAWKQRRLSSHMPTKETTITASPLQELFLALLFAVNNLETRSAALKLFSQLCSQPNICEGRAMEQAAHVLEEYIGCNSELLSDFADNVLPVILDEKSQFEAFLKLYSSNLSQNESKLVLYLAVLKAGRMRSFISEEALPSLLYSGTEHSGTASPDQAIRYQNMSTLLRAGDAEIRVHTYDLITVSFATKAPIPADVLQCVLGSLRYIHDDNNAYERGELLGITRRFLKRLTNSYLSLLKLQSGAKLSDVDAGRILDYESFASDFASFLSGELEIGIAYQRHILALQSLQQLLKTPFDGWFDEPMLQTRVATLVLDAYDDVRTLSAEVLSSLYSKIRSGDHAKRHQLSDDAVSLAAQTCRHDHADAAGRMLAIVAQTRPCAPDLQGSTGDAMNTTGISLTQDLLAKLLRHLGDAPHLRPDSNFPLHAYILGLTHALSVEEIKEQESLDILRVCSRIWALVKDELCVDSPETGTEDLEDDGLTGPKDLLAYAWRALRDSSLVLQCLIKRDQRNLEQAGSICMEQLTQLRHRGAFSTVAQTFAICCAIACTSSIEKTRSLVDEWRKNALTEIDVQASKVTRRSAGIPAMFNAVLSASDLEIFDVVISTLKAKALQPVSEEELRQPEQSLPQVHALNCIKDIVTHSKFRPMTERYIVGLIALSADRMSSDLWTIRNCGLMLLRACMLKLDSKILGPTSSQSEALSTPQADRNPMDVALDLLQNTEGDSRSAEHTSRGSEQIFAGLDLVKHIGSSGNLKESLSVLIRHQFKNPIWGIRDHAARVLADIEAPTISWETLVATCSITPSDSENQVHGRLLYFRYSFDVIASHLTATSWNQINATMASLTCQMSERRKSRNVSPFAEAALLDLVNAILRTVLLRRDTSTVFRQLTTLTKGTGPHKVYASNAYYAQRYLLNKLLLLLLDKRQATNADVILPELSADPDVMEYVAENLQLVAAALPSGVIQPDLGDVLARVSLLTESDLALASLMTTIALNLEQRKITLAPTLAQQTLDKCGTLAHDRSRHLENSRIRLYGALVSLLGLEALTTSTTGPSLSDQIAAIVGASRDQVDFPTRLAAAQAVASMIREVLQHRSNLDAQGDGSICLRLLTLLYDQLNDDDEDIRELAQWATMTALNVSGRTQSSLRPCSLASREALLDLIVDFYGASEILPRTAIARISGSGSVAEEASGMLIDTVQSRLTAIMKSMNDLFTEERQNLYIDELDEIQQWSAVLCKCKGDTLSADLWMQSARWCLAGIQTLRAASSASPHGDSSTTHTTRLTKNLDVLELCMRVVHLSQTLVSVCPPASVETREQNLENLRDEVTEQLQGWKSEMYGAAVHPLLLATISHRG